MPAPADIVWISDNYHDLHDPFFAPADVAKVNAAVFKALKPGGIYLVLDHAARPARAWPTPTPYRIDAASVKSEVEAAGFKLVGESDALKNPADDHSKLVVRPLAARPHRPVHPEVPQAEVTTAYARPSHCVGSLS